MSVYFSPLSPQFIIPQIKMAGIHIADFFAGIAF
jgi:hypothetical protein